MQQNRGACRFAEERGVEFPVLLRKAQIDGAAFSVGLIGCAVGAGPGVRAVDGFAVLLEPRAQFLKPVELDGRYGAVGFRAYVEEQVAVLADDVDEDRKSTRL